MLHEPEQGLPDGILCPNLSLQRERGGVLMITCPDRMARYHQGMNSRLYTRLQLHPAREIAKNHLAFFGSDK